MKSITTLTVNPSVDLSTATAYVKPEAKLRCGPPRYEPGGGGINVSRAIAKLGGTSRAVFTAGGVNGERLADLLDKEHVDVAPYPVGEETRVNITVSDESGTSQYRFVMPGPTLQDDEMEALYDAVFPDAESPDILVASGSIPGGTDAGMYGVLARECRKRDVHFILDASGEPLVRARRCGIGLLKCNMREFGTLIGRSISEEADLESAAVEEVTNGTADVIVVSLGAGGAVYARGDTVERLRSPTVPIRSKVGAGDSMVAGITLLTARGEPLHNAVAYGVAAGAAAVMTPGTELCRRDDAERIYKRLAGG